MKDLDYVVALADGHHGEKDEGMRNQGEFLNLGLRRR